MFIILLINHPDRNSMLADPKYLTGLVNHMTETYVCNIASPTSHYTLRQGDGTKATNPSHLVALPPRYTDIEKQARVQ